MVVRLLAMLLLTLSCLQAKESSISQIEAHNVDYDGTKIRLAGDVRIEHSFGELRCQRAVVLLAQESQAKRSSADRILLAEDVEVTLKDGARLTSHEADLDCNVLEAVFTATSPAKVVYITAPAEGEVPMKVSSRAMRVKMKKDDTGYVVSDVQGEDTVIIEAVK